VLDLRTRPPLALFLWTRAGIWLAALLAIWWFEPKPPALQARWDDPALHDLGYGIDLWARWDSAWYLRIAEHGYGSRPGSAAFYPLYPALVGGLGRVFAGHYVLAGVVVSLAACAIAFVLLYRLALPRLGAERAGRAVLYLAVFPMTLFLQAVYAESLFLALALAAFLLAERGRIGAAGVAAGLACLTRPLGFALVLGLVVLAGRRWPRLAAAPLLFALYPLYLWWRLGDARAFAHSQDLWHRRFLPLGGVWEGIAAAFDWHRAHDAAVNLEALGALALFMWLAVLAWRRLGAAYGVFAAAALAIPLSVPSSRFPLLSLPRFGLVVFPCFLALATLGERRHTAIVAVSCALLGVVIVQWVQWQWVS
jgi:hypothetical protein